MQLSNAAPRIIDSRHPSFLTSMNDWREWRLTYRSGKEFRNQYLEHWTNREDTVDFHRRRDLTPIPSSAGDAIKEIRNAIFQRMRDIVRINGSSNYMRAVNGLDLGVDRRGLNMNGFLGMKCLTDLLVMGKVGVFVDNSIVEGPTLADAIGARPYLYPYQVEDILNWSCSKPEQPSEFQSILLRDTVLNYDRMTLLPIQQFQRFRKMWIDQNTGYVNLQFYDQHGVATDREGNPDPTEQPIKLELTRIPFVLLDIGDSLIKNLCGHEIALLNLASGDVDFVNRANFPVYIEAHDMRKVGGHLKNTANPDGTATAGGQGAHDTDMKVGVAQGRFYDKDVPAPSFIHPSSEPITASGALQQRLEDQIRKKASLALQNLANPSSAASKTIDNQALEAGLSFIGLVLENAERQIAEFWAAYEEKVPSKRSIAVIKYPDRYSLKNDADRIDEATKLSKLMFSLPGRIVKKEIAKSVISTLLSGKTGIDVIEQINKEIDDSKYLTSDPNTIIQAVEAGLAGEQVGSMALGFDDNEFMQARSDHALRVARIMEAQSAQLPGPERIKGSRAANASIAPPKPEITGDPAARGSADLSANPQAGKQEKSFSQNPNLNANRQKGVRGNDATTPVGGKTQKD